MGGWFLARLGFGARGRTKEFTRNLQWHNSTVEYLARRGIWGLKTYLEPPKNTPDSCLQPQSGSNPLFEQGPNSDPLEFPIREDIREILV